jgi:hypothetical protein
MGKAARQKKERRETRGRDPLRSVLRAFDRDSVLTLIGAALCSPTAAHQLAALNNIRSWILSTAPGRGTRQATPAELPLFVAAAHQSEPRLISLTDSIPKDPRTSVMFRHRDRLFRVHPADMERPIAVLTKAEFIAETIDPVLIEAIGFGLADYLDILLGYMDSAIHKLASSWSAGPPDDPTDLGWVAEEEVETYRDLRPPGEFIDECPQPARSQLALEWATRDVNAVVDLTSDLLDRFGAALAIRTRDGTIVPEPPSQCCAALDHASLELATIAVATCPELEDQLFSAACNAVARQLRRLNFPMMPQVVGPGIARATILMRVADRTFVAVEIVLLLDSTRTDLGRPAERLERLQPGQQVTSLGAQFAIPKDARIVRLIVGVSPTHSIISSSHGIAGMSLEDLDWVTAELAGDPDAFWWFVRDVADPPGIGRLMGFETINVFQHWRRNQSLLTAGMQHDLVLIEPHQGDAEYWQAAERLPIEEALLACGLPAIRHYDLFETIDDDVLLYDRERDIGIRVLSSEVPVCIQLRMPQYPGDRGLFVDSVSGAISWKIERMPSLDWVVRRGIRGLLITLDWNDDARLTGYAVAPGQLTIELSEHCYEICQRDASEFEQGLGGALVESLATMLEVHSTDSDLAGLLRDWEAASPGIRMEAYSMPQTETSPPKPENISRPAVRAYEHELNRRLAHSSVTSGSFTGTEARDFESQTVAPTLVSILHEAIARFDASALLQRALRQYDLAQAARISGERNISFPQRFPVYAIDPAEATKDLVEESQQLTRAQAIVIEELLVKPPAGSQVPDRIEWAELLALAQLLFDSQMRSETIHVGLTPMEIVITEAYEIEFNRAEGQAKCDMSAFSRAYLKATEIGPRIAPEPDGDSERRTTEELVDAAVDQALLAELGFRLVTLTGVLGALMRWQSTSRDPPDWVTAEEVVNFCQDMIIDGEPEQIRAAMMWLILTPELLGSDPLEHWEQERRDVRLLTRPLVMRSDRRIAIMPWAIESTARVYARYISDGRLPWTRRTTPPQVLAAMDAYRQRRNSDLEDEAYQRVAELGLPCRKRVRPNKARLIGLHCLSGEIDLLVADQDRNVIWILEVKDPQEAFSPRQVSNGIDDFVGTGYSEGFVAKLLRKVGDVSVDPGAVARALGVDEPSREWTIRSAMVTRRPVAAAFANTGVPFVTVDELAELIGR